ncbi:hypothetical protein NM688_g8966 [Phlebia brevispora]|uniref:Uncharacterized protein n=1 Tax=Phlebia brevispora TaxID=194682 RepID=A0ACC1RME1_9APHY|nr:hypothetical protein NM688_g8966 [Phlebia brevispora]
MPLLREASSSTLFVSSLSRGRGDAPKALGYHEPLPTDLASACFRLEASAHAPRSRSHAAAFGTCSPSTRDVNWSHRDATAAGPASAENAREKKKVAQWRPLTIFRAFASPDPTGERLRQAWIGLT